MILKVLEVYPKQNMSMSMSTSTSLSAGMMTVVRVNLRTGMAMNTRLNMNGDTVMGKSVRKYIWKNTMKSFHQSAEKAAAHGRRDQTNGAEPKWAALQKQTL